MRRLVYLLLVSSVYITSLLSCKPKVPGKYIQPDDMEDILFDYHIAMGMITENQDDDKTKVMYEAAVLREHGVSKAEFDSSLVYYTRHADRFHTIYENLSKRFSEEAVSLGGYASDIKAFDVNVGDTTNVWNTVSSLVLSPAEPYNVESFYIKADTTYHKGDRIVLFFTSNFIYQDGYKDGMAVLAVKYYNDSIATRTVRISESRRYDVSVNDDAHLGIKEIRGFFSLQKPQNATESTMKLMFVDDIHLIRCRPKQENLKP